MAAVLASPLVIDTIPLFAGLNDKARNFLREQAQVRHTKRNESILYRGQWADGLHVVIEGRVKLSLAAMSSSDKVIEICRPGDQFGESMMFLDGPHLIDAHALCLVTYAWISKSAILHAMSLDPRLSVRLLEALSRRFVALLADIESTNCLTARERLYRFLLSEPRSGNRVTLQISKGTVASKLGIAQETLSREFKQLSRDGVIRMQGATIELLQLQDASGASGVSGA
jgi:CRP/FNR family transcriptional regulator